MSEHSSTALADPPRAGAHPTRVPADTRGPKARQAAAEVVECHCFDPARLCNVDHANE
jgi:hypothetical protein